MLRIRTFFAASVLKSAFSKETKISTKKRNLHWTSGPDPVKVRIRGFVTKFAGQGHPADCGNYHSHFLSLSFLSPKWPFCYRTKKCIYSIGGWSSFCWYFSLLLAARKIYRRFCGGRRGRGLSIAGEGQPEEKVDYTAMVQFLHFFPRKCQPPPPPSTQAGEGMYCIGGGIYVRPLPRPFSLCHMWCYKAELVSVERQGGKV